HREQDVRVGLGDLPEAAVADLGELAVGAGADPGAALALLAEQTHLTEKGARVEEDEDDLVTVLVFHQYRHRTLDDVVDGIRLVAGIDDSGLRRIAAPVAMLEQVVDGRVARRLLQWLKHSPSFGWRRLSGLRPALG